MVEASDSGRARTASATRVLGCMWRACGLCAVIISTGHQLLRPLSRSGASVLEPRRTTNSSSGGSSEGARHLLVASDAPSPDGPCQHIFPSRGCPRAERGAATALRSVSLAVSAPGCAPSDFKGCARSVVLRTPWRICLYPFRTCSRLSNGCRREKHELDHMLRRYSLKGSGSSRCATPPSARPHPRCSSCTASPRPPASHLRHAAQGRRGLPLRAHLPPATARAVGSNCDWSLGATRCGSAGHGHPIDQHRRSASINSSAAAAAAQNAANADAAAAAAAAAAVV